MVNLGETATTVPSPAGLVAELTGNKKSAERARQAAATALQRAERRLKRGQRGHGSTWLVAGILSAALVGGILVWRRIHSRWEPEETLPAQPPPGSGSKEPTPDGTPRVTMDWRVRSRAAPTTTQKAAMPRSNRQAMPHGRRNPAGTTIEAAAPVWSGHDRLRKPHGKRTNPRPAGRLIRHVGLGGTPARGLWGPSLGPALVLCEIRILSVADRVLAGLSFVARGGPGVIRVAPPRRAGGPGPQRCARAGECRPDGARPAKHQCRLPAWQAHGDFPSRATTPDVPGEQCPAP